MGGGRRYTHILRTFSLIYRFSTSISETEVGINAEDRTMNKKTHDPKFGENMSGSISERFPEEDLTKAGTAVYE